MVILPAERLSAALNALRHTINGSSERRIVVDTIASRPGNITIMWLRAVGSEQVRRVVVRTSAQERGALTSPWSLTVDLDQLTDSVARVRGDVALHPNGDAMSIHVHPPVARLLRPIAAQDRAFDHVMV